MGPRTKSPVAHKKKVAPGRKGADRFNDRQRRAIQLRVEDGLSMDWEVYKAAGYGGTRLTLRVDACTFFRRADVRLEMGVYREKTVTKSATVDKAWIMRNAQTLFEDVRTPMTAKLPVLRLLAEMVQGALVPSKVEVDGKITLESWVAAMGGKPEDAPDPTSALAPHAGGQVLEAKFRREAS